MQGLYHLDTFDGRHGKISQAEKDAAIHEGGREFVYVHRIQRD